MHIDDLPTINKLVAEKAKLTDDADKLINWLENPPPDGHASSCMFNTSWFHPHGTVVVSLMRVLLRDIRNQIEEVNAKLTAFGVSVR